jgi:hypothetical protein
MKDETTVLEEVAEVNQWLSPQQHYNEIQGLILQTIHDK